MADPLDFENGLMQRKIAAALMRASGQFHNPQQEIMQLAANRPQVMGLSSMDKQFAMGGNLLGGDQTVNGGAFDHLQNLKEQREEMLRAQMKNASQDMDRMTRLKYGLKD